MNRLSRYRITVISLAPRRYEIPEDGIFINVGDTIGGWGFSKHEVSKYFDLWFTNPKGLDRENYITFGKVLRIEEYRKSKGLFYVTKIGRFLVEEVSS